MSWLDWLNGWPPAIDLAGRKGEGKIPFDKDSEVETFDQGYQTIRVKGSERNTRASGPALQDVSWTTSDTLATLKATPRVSWSPNHDDCCGVPVGQYGQH
ncbi:hypothetical protein VM1G_06153 [Cytospora mali]|uniref:Uncharacterized protein n=1 Tax=Cytospora mali TaxID=578113 RepID=A0A194W1G1_CYTMA|nr:hypothetical protein VM1G_06153 [Valsa mali]